MQLNPSEISELLKARIEGLGASTDVRTQGTVVSVTDGICRIHGLSDVMQGEMLEFRPASRRTDRGCGKYRRSRIRPCPACVRRSTRPALQYGPSAVR